MFACYLGEEDVDGKLVVGRLGEGWTREGRGAMGEGRGGWQGFGERGKCREVAGRRDGRRQEAGVSGLGRSTGGIKEGQLLVLKSVVRHTDHAKSGGHRLCHFQFGGGVVA